jgi:hypothetical protein
MTKALRGARRWLPHASTSARQAVVAVPGRLRAHVDHDRRADQLVEELVHRPRREVDRCVEGAAVLGAA